MSIDQTHESERLTRKKRVDPRLLAAGWKIVPFDEGRSLGNCDGCAIEEYPTENGPADYALCVGGRILGVVEAKRVTLGTQEVLTQAERYSKGVTANPLNFRGYRVPFLYSTNGEVIWHHDIRHELNRSRRVAGFHTPAALAERLGGDFEAACTTLNQTPNAHPMLRPYQRDTNWTRSALGRECLLANAKWAVNQASINQTDVCQTALPLPSLGEQREIVRRVEVLFKLADTVEARAKAATVRAERLTQSILAKAFRGELVPTEAELARREGRSYEPASVLLARIRTARGADAGGPNPRGRRSKGRTQNG